MKLLERIGIKILKKKALKALPALPDRIMEFIKDHDDEFIEKMEAKAYEILVEMADKAAQTLDNSDKK